MKNRILSLLLCLCTVFSSVGTYMPAIALDFLFAEQTGEPCVRILYNGTETGELALGEFEKKTVIATANNIEPTSAQWQILMPDGTGVWVNVLDKTSAECEISSALVEGMLDSKNEAYLRCKMSADNGVDYCSAPIKVQITPKSPEAPEEQGTRSIKRSSAGEPSSASENGESETYVTITVKYLREESGKEIEVYKPYVANIVAGTDFAQTVISPTLLGYAPKYDSDGDGQLEDASSIVFNLASVSSDIEIKVYYEPIEVNYSVRYFFQNVGDDLYTENAGLFNIRTALTGTVVTEDMLKLSDANSAYTVGFTKMYHIPDAVAADGSTVFECYYDRLYYLLIFDNNGGYGTDPIYARYGTPFVVNDPIRYGYVFKGWDIDGNGIIDDSDKLPSSVEATSDENGSPVPVTYTAVWERVDTKYTVAYWAENGSGKNYFLGSTVLSAKSGEIVSGGDNFTSAPSYLEYVDADTNVEVAGDGSTVVNVYYKHKDYTLRFYYARSQTNTSGETVYQVVGGSTYAFGANGSDTTVAQLLKNPPNWGKVKSLPQIDDKYISNTELQTKYQLRAGSTDADFDSTYTYYYLEFTAPFNSDISEVWPVDIFEPVEVNEVHSAHGGTNDDFCPTYKYAYFSAWNGQYGVKYSHSNTNQTIKGMYQYLDENLIFDGSKFPNYADRTEISYLCFWENGANVDWSKPKIFEYNIYLEDASGNYNLFRQFNVYDNSEVEQQTHATIDGYSYDKDMMKSTSGTDEATGLEKHVISFYYKLETDNYFYFYNYNETEKTISGIPYGTSLSDWLKNNGYGDYMTLPPYPKELEENAYTFGGWYTTPDCYEGTEFDLNSETMPSNDLTLYASWKPVSHEVNFFVTLDELRQYESGESVSPYYSCTGDKKVLHGNVVGSLDNPTNAELTFKGWFYIDEREGGKKAFVPTAMPINKDLNIYAEWESHTVVPFTIRYVLLDDPNTAVADDTTGYFYASTTRTFQAKAGEPLDQLYEQYNRGYYPTVSSHSITMQLDPEQNVYTFYYKHIDKIKYTVNYINKETNVVMDTETLETDRSVITVTYKHYDDMIPDAFYKQLVLSTNESDNVINFYYTPNTVKVYYAVHYMLEKLDANATDLWNYSIDGSGGYEDSGTYHTGIDDKGTTVTVSPAEFTGFTVTSIARVVSGESQSNANSTDGGTTFKIDDLSDGDELYIFYTRNSYNYKVHYYKYNTTESVRESTSDTAKWGTEISLASPTVDGYECVNLESDGMRHLTVKDKEEGNELIFYYAPLQRTIEYVAVVDGKVLDGAGRLSNSREIVTGSETIDGSVAHSDAFYRFVGWFADEACTQPLEDGVHGSLADTDGDKIADSFVPSGASLTEKNTNVFYARFEAITGDITVILSGSREGEISVIEIKNLLTGEVILATVVGDGKVVVKNVHLNNYTVSVNRSWSWRYKDSTVNCVHSNTGGTTVQLNLVRENEKWLGAQSDLVQNTHSGVNANGQ